MQIKQQTLAQQLQKKIAPLYLLTGQDIYLIEESLLAIKSAIKNNHDCDEKLLSVQSPEDWKHIIEEANNYSLFSDCTLLNIYFDKKNLDAAGKKVITEYLSSINQRCFIIIRAPNVPAKQLQWLTPHEQAMVVVAYPMNADAIKNWIANQFHKYSLPFDKRIPDLIHQYTQGNMLACAQVIEKISLSYGTQTEGESPQIGIQEALEHLSDQSEHSLYELIDACLLGNSDKAIQILRQAANNKSESTLVLWMLTQEVRTLLQLSYLTAQKTDFKTAASQLKIWPQRVSLYQMSMKRFTHPVLRNLLHYCQLIDEQIKSSFSSQVWPSLECLALSLSIGQPIGAPCTL